MNGVEAAVTPGEHATEVFAALRAAVAERSVARAPAGRLVQVLGHVPDRRLPAVDVALRERLSDYREDGWPRLGLS